MIKECKTHGLTEHTIENRGTWRCKQCRVDAVIKRRRKLKQKAVEYLGGECMRCGYNKCIAALEFHHRNPGEKSFGLSTKGITRSWDKILAELDKCDLLCANCHREVESTI